MLSIPVAFISGLIFGFGLLLSRMIDPVKVQNFFDLTGNWDANLAFVAIGAIAVAALGFRLGGRPRKAERFPVPARASIDPPLVGGAVLFGIGLGMTGYFPGSAVASLLLGRSETGIFVLAMIGGMAFYRLLKSGAS